MPLAVQLSLLLFASAYWAFSFLAHRSSKRLGSTNIQAVSGAKGREKSLTESYFYAPLHFRLEFPLRLTWILLMATVLVVGYLVVFVMANYPELVGLLIIQAWLIYTQFDSIEAYLLGRSLGRASMKQLGPGDLEQMRWVVDILRSSRLVFLLLGSIMFSLSFVIDQVTLILLVLLAFYAGIVYRISDIFAASPHIQVVTVFMAFIAVILLLAWLGRKIIREVFRFLSLNTKSATSLARPPHEEGGVNPFHESSAQRPRPATSSPDSGAGVQDIESRQESQQSC